MAFSSIIGQERTKRLLTAAWKSGTITGAYLFYGISGVGKDALAMEFAKLLNCENSSDAGACGTCHSCKRAAAMQHPNIKFICALPLGKNEDARRDDPISKLEPDTLQAVKDELQKKWADPYYTIAIPKAREIKLSSVREIKKELSFSSQGGKRVVIISHAEDMNTQSQNALLKTLEEPPTNTVFILTSSARNMLKATILSRCQLVRCDALNTEEIARALVEREGIPSGTAELYARLGAGSYADALRHNTEEFAEARKTAVDFLRFIAMKKYDEIYAAAEGMARLRDRTAIEEFIVSLSIWFRDAEALRSGGRDALLETDMEETLAKFNERYPHTRCDVAVKRLNAASNQVRQNVNIQIIIRSLAADLHAALEAA